MKYKITCKNCKSDQVIEIDERRIIIWGHADRIISGRYRLDNKWGWQCICGANDLMTIEEEKFWDNKANPPKPKEMKNILENLKQRPSKFIMESA